MPALPSGSGLTERVAGSSYADALVLRPDDRILWARGRGPRHAARDGRELTGTPVLDLVADADRERATALLGAARTTGALLIDTLRLADDRVVEVALHDLTDLGLLVETWDVTARDARERDLRERSLHDPLTGVANRVLLLDRLEWALTPRRTGPAGVGALFIDVDGFKRVNDKWGHALGDAVLSEVAARIDSVLRTGDTVGRLGGDEFGVVCVDLEDPDDLRRVGSRVCEALRQPAHVVGVEVPLQASVGGAICLDGSADADRLLGSADAAMYDAKSGGGGTLRLRLLTRSAEVPLP